MSESIASDREKAVFEGAALPFPPPRWGVAVAAYALLGLSGSLVPPSRGHEFSLAAAVLFGLVMAAFSLLTYGILWTYLGSTVLRGVLDLPLSIQVVGHCFLPPALTACGLSVFGWLVYLLDPATPVERIFRGGRLVLIVWGIVSTFRVVSRLNRFSTLKSLAFVAGWFVAMITGFLLWRVVRL